MNAKNVFVLLGGLALALTACSPSSATTAATAATAATATTASPPPELTEPAAPPVVSTPYPLPPLPELPAMPLTTVAEIVEGVVIARYEQRGVAITLTEWQDLSDYICSDLAAGGSGRWLNDAGRTAPAEVQQELADLNLDGATLSQCSDLEPELPPGAYSTSNISADLPLLQSVAVMEDGYEYEQLLSEYEADLMAYGRQYDVDVSGLLPSSTGSTGSGYRTVCADGSVSNSGGRQGACSHHGGLR